MDVPYQIEQRPHRISVKMTLGMQWCDLIKKMGCGVELVKVGQIRTT